VTRPLPWATFDREYRYGICEILNGQPRYRPYIVLRKSRFSMGLNYGPILRRLWTKVHQIMSADAGERSLQRRFRLNLPISCSVPEIFASEVRTCEVVRNRAKERFSVLIF